MPGRNALFVPGPTNTPDRILRAMHRAMEDHRSSSFPALTRPILSDLRRVFRTDEGQCFVFPATGTSEDVAMLLADDKGATLIVAVGTHATLVEFLDKGRSGMASTFLTRLRVGGLGEDRDDGQLSSLGKRLALRHLGGHPRVADADAVPMGR